jgi:integrase
VFERPDGRWEARLELRDLDGRRRRKSFYGRTQSEALAKLHQAQRQLDDGLPMVNERLTTGEYLEHWASVTMAPLLRPATADSYAALVRLHLKPFLGKVPLAKLTPEDVECLLASKQRDGLSPNTVRLIRSTLRRALGMAERRGLVVRNVATLVDGPRIGDSTRRAMTAEEARSLLEVSADHRLGALFALLLETGLRRGEALGLLWQDVDLDGQSLNVCHTMIRVAGKLTAGEPKTRQSRRIVHFSGELAATLRTHRRRQLEERLSAGPGWHETGHVFASSTGTPLDPSNVRSAFAQLCQRAALGHWTIHELRHTAASLMLSAGVPLHVVSDVLGHSSISITKDVYGHLVADDRERASEAISSVLYRAGRAAR